MLDLACGKGRHTRLLADRGHPITAVDIDVSGLIDLREDPRIEIRQANIETSDWMFSGTQFAAIIVSNYLYRPHFIWLADSLQPGGVLLMETFAQGNEAYGRPQNPDFLLVAGELLSAFGNHLQIVAYEHGLELQPKVAVRQRICAVNTATCALLNAT